MSVNKFLWKLDKLICTYLGIRKEQICPTVVEVIGDQLAITNTTSFKRHAVKESWENFSISSIKHTNQNDKEKLGLAAGQAIADKLVISFDEPVIKTIKK